MRGWIRARLAKPSFCGAGSRGSRASRASEAPLSLPAELSGSLRSIRKTVLLLGDTREQRCTYFAHDAVVCQQLGAVNKPLVFDSDSEQSEDVVLDV